MKRNVLFALFTLGFALFLYSCKKINQPTDLGDDLLPAVDNVNTFDTTFEVAASYRTFPGFDTASAADNLALGQISDPVFGSTNADMYFNLSSSTYGSSPFINKAAVTIDSVVLSLAYVGVYGDSTAALSVAVSEIAPQNGFDDTVVYRYEHPGFNTTGSVLGTRTFSAANLKDSITITRKGDTTRVANVLRIRLDNSLGSRFSQFDTTDNGAFKNDSLFRDAFKGLAVKTTSASNPGALAYFNPTGSGTALYVYYTSKNSNGSDTSATASFVHNSYLAASGKNYYGIANSVLRTPGGEYLAGLDQAPAQKLYLQSSPSGSYVGIYVAGLNGFPNKVIHRAELIAYRLPSMMEEIFTAPTQLLLDHKDSLGIPHLFDNDIQFSSTGSVSLNLFGGTIKNDSYKFNITRYVQGIVTRNEPNDSLRLYAPLRSRLYSKALGNWVYVPALSNIAQGRVVLAGTDYPDPAMKLRLRVVYSNL